MLRKIIVGSIEKIMGTESLGSISESIAKIGLRGLGVNIDHGIESGGEDRLLARLFNTTKGMACFDVGGNVGDYTAALLDKGARQKLRCLSLHENPSIASKRGSGAIRVCLCFKRLSGRK